ncbi:Ribosomal small subunit pseudouridine synthase A [Sinobacterium norvegicum]|uniref:Pseudouridine synthase n=1 Tax=Sinobacterium norvegicum TaxID=1641715 RepID=A0ABN8EFI8_9GAMM|nr:pseudouridine synthase [Sinobacterium norvegicum]CAH0991123.1 Ribosomal small subunit pseudouridine synthase A [Sinobacterium norvegicum]
MRLDRFLCRSTTLNRQQASQRIAAGEVTVNGKPADEARMQVHEDNLITLSGKTLSLRPARYIMLHKPANTVCSNVDDNHPSVMNGLDIPNAEDLHIAGRLDADTTGLVLVTDDGRWSFAIFNPKYLCQKVYRVDLRDPINDQAISQLQQGLLLQGEKQPTLPATVTVVSPQRVSLSISEGKYHQVKRMFAAVGNRVTALHRQQVGALKLDLECGHWRDLTAEEAASFYHHNDIEKN